MVEIIDCLFEVSLFAFFVLVVVLVVRKLLSIFNMMDPKIDAAAWLIAGLLVLLFVARCFFGAPMHLLH